MTYNLYNFIKESNQIEGILREPTEAEMETACTFMDLGNVELKDLFYFVGVYQPNAILRDREGLDVQVGDYIAPRGCISIRTRLEDLLADMDLHSFSEKKAYEFHVRYEMLHPFTDCNGRSGRILWRWMMRHNDVPLGFLHTFYYQTLRAATQK